MTTCLVTARDIKFFIEWLVLLRHDVAGRTKATYIIVWARRFVGPISCPPSPPPPGSVVDLTCHDDHQKVKGFLLRRGS